MINGRTGEPLPDLETLRRTYREAIEDALTVFTLEPLLACHIGGIDTLFDEARLRQRGRTDEGDDALLFEVPVVVLELGPRALKAGCPFKRKRGQWPQPLPPS